VGKRLMVETIMMGRLASVLRKIMLQFKNGIGSNVAIILERRMYALENEK
jgi:hypothetical protein